MHTRALRLTALGLAAVAATGLSGSATALSGTALASSAGTNTGYYDIKQSTATYNALKVNNLFPTSVDDSSASLSVSGTGAYKMPFAVWMYNLRMNTMNVSSNGNIQFWTNTDRYDNTCLPSSFGDPSGESGRALAVFWDDLYIDRAKGDGVFTQTTGAKGSRQYTIAWQGRLYANRSSVVKASVTFFENSKNIRMNYGSSNAGQATIGVQLSTTYPKDKWTQYACNWGYSPVKSGTVLNYIHHT